MVANFTLTLLILCGISFIILIVTGISIKRSSANLTSFEKKVLFGVAFVLCAGIILLYIFSNLDLFFALLR